MTLPDEFQFVLGWLSASQAEFVEARLRTEIDQGDATLRSLAMIVAAHVADLLAGPVVGGSWTARREAWDRARNTLSRYEVGVPFPYPWGST